MSVTRDQRQTLCIKRWKEAGGRATIEAATGFGKTNVAVKIISALYMARRDLNVLVVVPTTTLKEQWEAILYKRGLSDACRVVVINTAIKYDWKCDLLVIDEVHRTGADEFSAVFKVVKYTLVLSLTATLERLDGKHSIIIKYCPIADSISILEALANGWVAPYKEYQVLIDVEDIAQFKALQKDFIYHFEFFNFDFDLAMSMTGEHGFRNKIRYRDIICQSSDPKMLSETLKTINFHAAGFSRAMSARKAFINNHPKKIEIARKIIEARPDKKIITFSNSVKMAESIGIGKVYSGKDTKKKGRITLDEIKDGKELVLNTCAKANEGLDLEGLSVAIMIGIDSAKIKAVQRIGRVIRYEKDKRAEIFNIVLNHTTECEWFKKSHEGMDYITIDEEGLNDVLQGKDPKPYNEKIQNFTFRY